jgi:hypothetical protein
LQLGYAYVVIVSSLLAKVDVPSGAGPTWAEFGVAMVVVVSAYVAFLLARTFVRSILASRSRREIE